MQKAFLDRNRQAALTAFLVFFLMISSFAGSVASSPQPPLDPTTYNIGTIGQPARMDPARAYERTSGELLQNVYQTLISCSDKRPIVFTLGVGYNLSVADRSDLTQYEPVLATEVPTVENGRLIVNSSGSYWRFTINTAAMFQNWTDHNGVVQPTRAITAADVVYSFRRQVVYDSIYSPDWMWMTPAFGYASWRSVYGGPYATYTNYTFKNLGDEAAAGALITNWCYNIGNDVYFYFTLPWAEGPLRQIFSQTWGSVVNPDWVKEMGGWDGLFTTGASVSDMSAGWTNNYHGKPTNTRSELDTYKSPTAFPGHGSKYSSFHYAACGTGPYLFTSWDTSTKTWRIDFDVYYWMGWANAGDGAGNFIHTVIWKGIDAWSTRKTLFLDGEIDVCLVTKANMHDLLQAGTSYNPLPGINLVYDIPSLANDVMLFTFNVSEASPYQSYVGYPTHIGGAKPYFFDNLYMRQAFAWALNYTSYVRDAWSGEAIAERSWWAEGLSPASYKNTNASMPQRSYSLTEMRNALNQAIVDGYNVSEVGFEVTLAYNIGNDQRMIACNMIATAFATLDAAKYKVNVIGLDWPVFLDAEDRRYLPMYDVSWYADFADPDDFCESYQASWGAFMSGQGPPFPEDQAFVDQEIKAALVESNFTTRGDMYMDLQYRYWLDAPSFPLIQSVTRRWARDWVQGWYFNALLPGEVAYDIFKSAGAIENVDIQISAAPLTPVYNPVYVFHGQMRIGNGNPDPAIMTYIVHVSRSDDNYAIPILRARIGFTKNSPQGGQQFICSSYASLAPGRAAVITVTWWEDGINQVMVGHHNGVPYAIAVEAQLLDGNANDTDISNNQQSLGTIVAKTLPGDANGNGIVNVIDAIIVSSAYGTTPSSTRWNANADLNADGIVNVLDCAAVNGYFNQHVP